MLFHFLGRSKDPKAEMEDVPKIGLREANVLGKCEDFMSEEKMMSEYVAENSESKDFSSSNAHCRPSILGFRPPKWFPSYLNVPLNSPVHTSRVQFA